METSIKLFPDKFCRTCLLESSKMKPLSVTISGENRTLLDVLNFVANVSVIIENGLPKQVCVDCETILVKAETFKRRCLESETILTQLFEINTHSTIENISDSALIKNENELDANQLDFSKTFLSTTMPIKAPETALSDIFDNLSTGDVKVKFLDHISDTKLESDILEDKKDAICSVNDEQVVNDVQVVKEEDSTEFDAQNDDTFDFGEAVTFEAEPVVCKKERTKEKRSKSVLDELRIFSCSCGTVFNTKDDYRLHLHARKCNGFRKSTKLKILNKNRNGTRNLTVKKKTVCPKCNLEFETLKECKQHQKSHSKNDDEGNFECTICMRKFNRKSSYTNHIKHHDLKSNVKFTCETCKREFQHKAHLDNHVLAVHSRDKGFLCDLCMTYFSTLESLEVHKDSHTVEKKHRCKVCDKAFYMLSSLNDHVRVHTGEKPYLCSICGRGFSQKTNLAQHMRRHQGLKPFKCEHCDRRFVSKGELTAHNRKHSGAHPFVCDECGSGFTTSSSLVKHRRVHTGERPYACDLCPRRFAASGTLKNHRRTHTGEKPFQCSYCEKAFVQRQDLISHIRGHTGERPYTCGCGQAFRKASSLKAHVRLHGKEPQRDLTLLQSSSMLIGSNIHTHTPAV